MCITHGEIDCNGVQLAYSKGLLRIPAKQPEKKSTLPTSPIRVKRNSHQYLRVLNSSIQTFHCVNEAIKNS